MFIDASAIVAILGREPDYEEIVKRLDAVKEPLCVSPLVIFESVSALARIKSAKKRRKATRREIVEEAQRSVMSFVEDGGVEQIEISTEIGRLAIAALAAYGRGGGNPAKLNFGDCFAYACAKSLGVGLIYKGNDFASTDLA
jgi:ribonuclease VapC